MSCQPSSRVSRTGLPEPGLQHGIAGCRPFEADPDAEQMFSTGDLGGSVVDGLPVIAQVRHVRVDRRQPPHMAQRIAKV